MIQTLPAPRDFGDRVDTEDMGLMGRGWTREMMFLTLLDVFSRVIHGDSR